MVDNVKLGLLGGGQLGTMLIRHGIDLGLQIAVMDADPDAPCARYTSSFCYADPLDYEAVINFGKTLDVITIEKEAVNTAGLRKLQEMGVRVFPSPDTIEIIQDKFLQKQFLSAAGIAVVPGIAVDNKEQLAAHKSQLPACLKKRRNGYDGYGVMMLREEADLAKAFDEPSVLEDLIDIEKEISVIVARNDKGEVKCYDPVVMVFNKDRFVLDYQLSDASGDSGYKEEACNIAGKIAEAFQLVGILAVEMFITTDGRLLVNELAPRPHNSGHHTIEAAVTSQYEQLLRAVLGLPLGDTRTRAHSLMVNILESREKHQVDINDLSKAMLAVPGVHLHWYGKKAVRAGRKIGHVTITDTDMQQAIEKTKTIRQILNQ